MKKYFSKENLINNNSDILSPKIIALIFPAVIPLFDGGFDNNIVYYALIISLIILIGFELQYKINISFEVSEPDFWLFIFLFFSASSFFWSIYQVRTIIEWLQLFTYFLIFIVIRRISKQEKHSVVKIALISASGIALLGIMEYIFVSTSRMVSTFTNPNPLATYLMMAFLFTIGVSLRSSKKLYYSVSIIFGTSFILTGSRGAFLSFIIALPFILLGIRKNNIFKTILKGAALILLSFVFANFIIKIASLIQEVSTSKTLISSITRIDSSMEVPKSITGRFEFWKVAFKLFKHQPIKGFGLGTFFSAYYIEYPGNEWFSRFAHNHYLQTLVELGLVGFGLFFAFLIMSAKNTWTRIKNKNYDLMFAGSLAASISFLLHIFLEFSWNFPGAALFFFLMLGIAVGPYKTNTNKIIKLKVNYRAIIVLLVFVLSLTLLNYTSIEILKKGTTYIENDNDKALEYIELGNKIYPINSIGYNTESKLYYQKYLDNKRIEYLDRALDRERKSVELTPYKWDLRQHLGKLYMEKGDNKNAEKELVLAVKYSSYIISPHLELSKLYRKMSMPEKAKVVLLEGLDVSEYAISKAPEEKNQL